MAPWTKLALLSCAGSVAAFAPPLRHLAVHPRVVQPPAGLAPRAASVMDSEEATNDQEQREQFDTNVMKTYGRYPITMMKGKGLRLWDSTGKEYLDFVAGISTCCLGHAHPGLVEAITKQMSTVHHVSNLYYIPNQGKLAEWLVKNSPADKVFFCNSGAEANEAALKLARKHAHTKLGHSDPVILTALSSFHGRTFGALTATGQPKYQKDFGPLLPGVEHFTYNDLESLRQAVEQVKTSGRGLAAIMVETLQGEGGIRPGDAAFFQAIRDICDETGALFICDEVQVGMGRSGKMWGFENLGVSPDVFTTAKALGAGVPIGAMLCKDKVNVFGPGDHATTFGGNPLACAAGMVVARAFEEEGLLENVRARGQQLRAGLDQLKADFPSLIKEVRGWGLLTGVELTEESGLLASAAVGSAIDNGLLLVPAGTHVVRFVPPLVVSAEEVQEALAIFRMVCEGHLEQGE
uniref:acetylornithine transaminase n=1 Tax=Rhizochromulina marina TaxID=1034831 RepID=A0A7S2S6J9_9STRA|mmetsp:Transcript_25844/g.75336  ORF Transcript_25844/g.75336 Transcript_25844/m.75336 type:complete len:464 (+) Transcript_25844:80-1471(+)